ncbi:hypothetical protein [Shinella zoogloeoides]|uniref:hypothetical protein n=1 Tax=Shinella zoogloeoides TaxID=352475 RepID=UPI00273D5D53|nr:hypothetical protein [Shinella zoogloeoides]WLR90917.1 hypothetical protein Q9316_00640 [Shinella zoogloeoides]
MTGKWKFACWFFGLVVGLWLAAWINAFVHPFASFFIATILGPVSVWLTGEARADAYKRSRNNPPAAR